MSDGPPKDASSVDASSVDASAPLDDGLPLDTPPLDAATRLASWMDAEGLGPTARPSSAASSRVGRRTRSTRSAAATCTLPSAFRHPAPKRGTPAIVREWRIIEALDGTDVPHTEAIAVCADPEVLGRRST